MNLLEHEAKKLLALYGIAIPKGLVVQTGSVSPFFPHVLKSQVPTGGRGKAGGIRIVTSEAEFDEKKKTLFSLPIKGHLPKYLLAEELLDIDCELYLSILINRSIQSVQIVAHFQGGIEVEDNRGFMTWQIEGSLDFDRIGQALADYYDLPDKSFILQDMIENLYTCFVQNDATLIEINPLILTKQGQLVAGDAKITLDDAASFRHDWNFSEERTNHNFVRMNPDGNVATLANGAGLAMATVDAVCDAGMTPANFFDIGGGASAETLVQAFSQIAAFPNVRAIVINIFAGITQSNEVARAIVMARDTLPELPPLFIRIAGTNQKEASLILKNASVMLYDTLESCLDEARKVVV